MSAAAAGEVTPRAASVRGVNTGLPFGPIAAPAPAAVPAIDTGAAPAG